MMVVEVEVVDSAAWSRDPTRDDATRQDTMFHPAWHPFDQGAHVDTTGWPETRAAIPHAA